MKDEAELLRFYVEKGSQSAFAEVVREMRSAWSGASVGLVHGAALEVGTALLHRGDVEMGEIVNGRFVPAKGAPWQLNEKMISEIEAAAGFFENEQACVFRRK